MTKSHYFSPPGLLALTALVASSIVCSHAAAQQARNRTSQPAGDSSIHDGVIQVQASLPAEIRIGEPFTYRVVVTNTSDSLTVHNLKLKQAEAEGFSIESTSMDGDGEQQQQQKKQQKKKQQTGDDSGQPREVSDKNQKNQQGEKASGRQAQKGQQQAGGKRTFTVGTLNPGESRTVTVRAAADKEGELKSCLEIDSYTPAMCLTSRVVKPELEIVKVAPEEANICEIIVVKYTIKNGGTGNIEQFRVIDDLPDGLVTIDGQESLEFEVDGLDAGQSRAFEGRLRAKRSGEFSSRAVAKASQADLQARSANTTTRVVAAELNTEIESQEAVYSGQPATFVARVTNTGDVAANDVQVRVRWPANTQLARLTDPVMGQSDSGRERPQSSVPSDVVQQQKQRSNQNQNQNRSMEEEQFTIASLEPNQTATFRYTIQPHGATQLPTEVIAQYVCASDSDIASDEAESKTIARATATTEVIRLAALRIFVIDNTDPVQQGQDVVYTIVVTNQGDAPDTNVKVRAELPKGLEFVSADGASEHQQEGMMITFEPIEQLAPGDDARYTITATAQTDAEVIFTATLSSDSVQKEVKSEEPTRLVSSQTPR